MRNKYPGQCYRCLKEVKAGEGHFERHKGGWRVQHASCAIEYKNKKLLLTAQVEEQCPSTNPKTLTSP